MTTGSEPRRYRDFFANGGKIELCDDCGGLVGWTGLRDGCCLGGVVCERTSTRLVESVESGHDEQAGLRNTESVIRADERERTVAAVVEALRSPEADDAVFRAQQHPQYMAAGEEGYIDEKFALAAFIEGRFEPSAPGGGNGHAEHSETYKLYREALKDNAEFAMRAERLEAELREAREALRAFFAISPGPLDTQTGIVGRPPEDQADEYRQRATKVADDLRIARNRARGVLEKGTGNTENA